MQYFQNEQEKYTTTVNFPMSVGFFVKNECSKVISNLKFHRLILVLQNILKIQNL